MSLELELATVDVILVANEVDKSIVAELFVKVLHKYNVVWHFDDDLNDIIWSHDKPSSYALDLMDKLRDDLYDQDLCQFANKLI